MGFEWCCRKHQRIHHENSSLGRQRFYLLTGASKNIENTMLSLGKKRWVEHFHDNHHRISPEVALILIVWKRFRVYYLL